MSSPFGFLKKKTEAPSHRPPQSAPIRPPESVREHSNIFNRVKELFSRGFSEPEVFRTLKKEGFNSLEIDRGIREYLKAELGTPVRKTEQADEPRPAAVKKPTRPPLTHEEIEGDIDESSIPRLPDLNDLKEKLEEEPMSIAPPSRVNRPIPPPMRRPSPVPHEPFKEPPLGRKEAEELIEVIVKEKLGELDAKFVDFEGKFKDYEAEIKELGQKVNKMLQEKETEIQGLAKKMDSYKDSMDTVKDRMDGIKTALEQTLVSVTDRIASLDNSIQGLKGRRRSSDE